MPGLHELDKIVLSFEDTDPVDRVKEALHAGNYSEASALIDGLTMDQLSKIAEMIPGLPESEQNTSTEEEGVSEDASADPEPDTVSIDGVAPTESTAGEEKISKRTKKANVEQKDPENATPPEENQPAEKSEEEVDENASDTEKEAYLVRRAQKGIRKALEKVARLAATPASKITERDIDKLAKIIISMYE